MRKVDSGASERLRRKNMEVLNGDNATTKEANNHVTKHLYTNKMCRGYKNSQFSAATNSLHSC